ncbi:hypothetical protein Gpo141_00010097 [Globisporangium polare]
MARAESAAVAPVRVSKHSFALWWLVLLLLHGVTGAFFSVSALFYWQLDGTYLEECLQFYRINTGMHRYSTIAILMGLVALPHGLSILRMVIATLYHRSFAFSVDRKAKRRTSTARLKSTQQRLVSSSPGGSSVCHWPFKMYHLLCDRNGVFGIEGKYFHVILFIREVFETSLQTNQAYRMSFYLQSVWLNRFYVTLLVLNCWLTPLIHLAYKKSEAKKRLLCLVCDCALDLMSAVVIPCTILASYVGLYDWEMQGFDIMVWYDDVWFVNAVNEFQMLLVVTWRDLGSRLVFSLGLLISMSDVKDLLIGLNNQVNPLTAIAPGAAPVKRPFTADPSTDELLAAISGITLNPLPIDRSTMQQRLRSAPPSPTSFEKHLDRFSKWTHVLLFIWGAVVLGLHSYAESLPVLSQCLLQVQPWGRSKPACSLVLLNCESTEISGSDEEIDAQWRILDENMVLRILVRHCAALEMPPVLQRFSQLQSLKVYNTTVAEWSEVAAITATHHPNLKSLFFVRVNMTDGELPSGLLSSEFPATVYDIEFSVTNLRSLPTDLDTKWPQSAMLYFEMSAFTSVLEVVLRLKPTYLSFYGNPIRELPSELFEGDSIEFLHIGATLVTSLPANVTFDANSNPLRYLYLSEIQLDYFPAWVDGIITAALSQVAIPIYAGDTPYCSQLEQIQAGSVYQFTVTQHEELVPPSVLMNASSSNLNLIDQSVSCNPEFAVAFFPLTFEDGQSSLLS